MCNLSICILFLFTIKGIPTTKTIPISAPAPAHPLGVTSGQGKTTTCSDRRDNNELKNCLMNWSNNWLMHWLMNQQIQLLCFARSPPVLGPPIGNMGCRLNWGRPSEASWGSSRRGYMGRPLNFGVALEGDMGFQLLEIMGVADAGVGIRILRILRSTYNK